jgi:hypothetical protein
MRRSAATQEGFGIRDSRFGIPDPVFDVDRVASLLENARESVAILVVNVGNRRDIACWI